MRREPSLNLETKLAIARAALMELLGNGHHVHCVFDPPERTDCDCDVAMIKDALDRSRP